MPGALCPRRSACCCPQPSPTRIWDYFATATIPDPDAAARVLALLGEGEPRSVPEIEAGTGLRRGRLEALLKTLRVDGAVDRVGSGWTATGRPWSYDADKYGRIVAARRAEAGLMRTYAEGGRCLMQVLTEALDDLDSGPCGRCSVCTGALPEPGRSPDPQLAEAARAFLRGRVQVLEPRRQWPSGSGRRGRVGAVLPGRAVAFADDPAWRELAAELAGTDAPPGPQLLQALVRALSRWSGEWEQRPVAVVPVPSRRCPKRVQGMAEHIAAVGRLPLLDVLDVQGPAPDPDGASVTRVRQLFGGLTVRSGQSLPEGPLLLVDDVARTRWTLTVAAALLLDAGAGSVLPLVAHRLP